MTTPVLIACGTAIAIVVVLSIVFFKPVKALFGLLLHTVIGWAGLYIFNRIFAFCAFSIGINIASASIAGILGLPGVALMAIVKLIYQI
ncbi:MAG: pro-sigmaK processing inhibitor BofA family protein [Oscillospiraceae bacterium]|nr:pro-sigmaK processing inhibitor BofA family protein [Oscillospiraceae bacterium]